MDPYRTNYRKPFLIIRICEFIFGVTAFALVTHYIAELEAILDITENDIPSTRQKYVRTHVISVATCAYPLVITLCVVIASLADMKAGEKSILAFLLAIGGVATNAAAGGLILANAGDEGVKYLQFSESQYTAAGVFCIITAVFYLADVLVSFKNLKIKLSVH